MFLKSTDFHRRVSLALSFLFLSLLSGCATMIKPENLSVPVPVTCIEIPDGVAAVELKGLLDFKWHTRLLEGPYISEWRDEQGTYYRAPTGGIYIGQDGTDDKPPSLMTYMHYDGGIWVPHDETKKVQLYTYFTTESVEPAPHPKGATCKEVSYIRDPQTKGVSTLTFATSGAVGGAIGGGVSGGSFNSNQAIGGGAAGAISGFIVAGLINMDVGKIVLHPVSIDESFVAKLDEFRQLQVVVPMREPVEQEPSIMP